MNAVGGMFIKHLFSTVLLACVPIGLFAQLATDTRLGNTGTAFADNNAGSEPGTWRWLPGGDLCLGMLLGDQPNALPSGTVNYEVTGSLRLDVLGVPIMVDARGSSVTPFQGRRTRIGIRLDTDRLVQKDQAARQFEVSGLDQQIDSLERRSAELERTKLGLTRRMMLLGVEVPAPTDTGKVPDALQPYDQATIPSLGPLLSDTGLLGNTNDLLPSQHSVFDPRGKLPEEVPEKEIDKALGRVQVELDDIGAQMSELKEARARASTLGQVDGPAAFQVRHPINFRKLEIGDCTSGSSEFLINGLSFQGISTEVGGKSWSVGLDHGRSFDDQWKNQQGATNTIQQLQRAFFFEDPIGTNPRRLTSVKGKIGLGDTWAISLGMLHASRTDVPFGVELDDTPSVPKHTNQVVEANVEKRIGADHSLNATLACSADHYSDQERSDISSSDDGGGVLRAMSGRFASRLKWTTVLPTHGLSITAGLFAVGAGFNSLGVAFLRQGSRAGNVSIDKSFGKTLRLRANLLHEQRYMQDALSMTIDRLRVSGVLRASRKLRYKITAIPQRTSTCDLEGHRRNAQRDMISTGADIDLLHGRTTLKLDADVARYAMREETGRTVSHVLRSGLRTVLRNGGQFGVRLNALLADDSTTVVDLSYDGAFKLGRSTTLELQATIPVAGNWGAAWSVNMQHMITQRWSIAIGASRIVRSDIYFSEQAPIATTDGYTCHVRMCYSW